MSIPSDYFYRQGWYWKADGTGPYVWSGTAMTLFNTSVPATVAASPVSRSLFNQNAGGPATKS